MCNEESLVPPMGRTFPYLAHRQHSPLGTDSVLIKFVKGFDICGVFEFFSMKIKVESAQN